MSCSPWCAGGALEGGPPSGSTRVAASSPGPAAGRACWGSSWSWPSCPPWSRQASLSAVPVVESLGRVVTPAVDPPLPPPSPVAQPTLVYDRNGRLLTRLHAGVDRVWVSLSRLPESLRNAVIAVEDRDFYEHEGLDLSGIARAALWDLRAGRIEQGGSTITQQYVKNAYTGGERSLARKAREALLALRLERRLSKDEILEGYLNTAYFGHGEAVRSHLPLPTDPEAALVAIDPSTGEVLALVGGRDFGLLKFNLAVQARRQAGSAFKVFTLAAARGRVVQHFRPGARRALDTNVADLVTHVLQRVVEGGRGRRRPSGGRRLAGPAPPRTPWTPGSAATGPSSPPARGWATRGRTAHALGARLPQPVRGLHPAPRLEGLHAPGPGRRPGPALPGAGPLHGHGLPPGDPSGAPGRPGPSGGGRGATAPGGPQGEGEGRRPGPPGHDR
jgi:hypothetical protein